MAVPDSEVCAQPLGWKVRITAVALAVASAALSNVGLKWLYSRGWIAKKRKTDRSSEISFGDGYPALIGGTKMIELKSLSEATGCLILVIIPTVSCPYFFHHTKSGFLSSHS